LWTIFAGLAFSPFLLFPKERLYGPIYIWIKGILLMLKIFCGVSYTINGKEHVINNNSKIIASKHQSTFETLILFYLIKKPIFIHKYELFFIPIFGLYLKKLDMISIDRAFGIRSLKKVISKSKSKISDGFNLIIFPEGTRKKPNEPTDYKSGIAGIYKEIDTDVIPVALNSGLFWPKHTFKIKPGNIVMEFLPPINRGLSKTDFLKTLESRIENKTKSLMS
tara:strand:- start:37859 stop:38524 length:666 start_codon:yes stop_codon:yes gene_type:complete